MLGEKAMRLRPKQLSCSGEGEERAGRRTRKGTAGKRGNVYKIPKAKVCMAHWGNDEQLKTAEA